MSDEDEVVSDGEASHDAPWEQGGFLDPFSTDAFTREIENIAESDWDLDVDELWGAVPGDGGDAVGDAPDAEFFG